MMLNVLDMDEEQLKCYEIYDGDPPRNCSSMKIPSDDDCKHCPARVCNENRWCPVE